MSGRKPGGSEAEGGAGQDQRLSARAIAEALQLDIIVGRLQPRERLVEDDLIGRFGVSRYTVRKALEEMQSLGLVVREANRGARIRSYTPKEVRDLFELREILEAGAANQIRMPVDPALVERLVAIQKQHDAAARRRDYFAMYRLNDEFHATLYGATGNAELQNAIVTFSVQLRPIRMRFVNDEERRVQISQEHWKMIEAMQQGDKSALARICRKHVSLTKEPCLRRELPPAGSAAAGGECFSSDALRTTGTRVAVCAHPYRRGA